MRIKVKITRNRSETLGTFYRVDLEGSERLGSVGALPVTGTPRSPIQAPISG